MPLRRRRTLEIVRLLHRIGPLPKLKKRLPKQSQPDLIRVEYWKALLPLVRVASHAFAHEKPELLRMVKEWRARGDARLDADDGKKRAGDLVDRAARRSAQDFQPYRVYVEAEKFARRTSLYQRDQLDRQVRAGLGVPLSMVEPAIRGQLEGFAALNVDLIKTVPDRYFDRIRQDVLEAYETGMHPDTLAELFEERDGMSERDALRIARDQIGKLNAQLNQTRQEAMGVTGYTWRTMNDNLVRDEHQELEGEFFTWDDPPAEGNPGEPIQCRCFAEPDFGPLLQTDEEQAAQEEPDNTEEDTGT